MKLLVAGMVIFIGTHLIPSVQPVRHTMMNKLGQKGYLLLFTILSFVGFGLIIVGMSQASYTHIWTPPAWGKTLSPVIMLFAFYCLVSKYRPSNFNRFSDHPMLYGVILWGCAHLLANGDLASTILFGGFVAFSLFDIFSANRRKTTVAVNRLPLTNDIINLVISLGLVAIVGILHPYLFGVPVFNI